MPRAVSKMGLAFVAWTRATHWARVAFQRLPPFEEFLAVRLQDVFLCRAAFEASADDLADAFQKKRGAFGDELIEAHRQHFQRARKEEGRAATEAELKDLDAMLQRRGVAPVSDSAAAWLRQKHGASADAGLLSLIASHRVDKSGRKAMQDKVSGAAKRGKNDEEHISMAITRQLLTEHGYAEEKIQAALAACGANFQRCVEHCLREVPEGVMNDEEAVEAEA